MNKRLIFALAAVLLSLSTFQVAWGQGPTGGQQSPQVTRQVIAGPSFEDKDWPVVQVETEKQTDPETGESYSVNVVTRRAPSGAVPRPQTSPCAAGSTTAVPTSCTYQGALSRTSEDSHLGGVAAHLAHYVYQWCDGAFCSIYQPYKLEVWWTRSDSNWDARDATTRWGCAGCWLQCDGGGTYSNVYTDGPFNPTWFGNSTSTVQYTGSWPRLMPSSFDNVRGNNSSSGYHLGGYAGGLYVEGAFN